jgi:hypothetical protein
MTAGLLWLATHSLRCATLYPNYPSQGDADAPCPFGQKLVHPHIKNLPYNVQYEYKKKRFYKYAKSLSKQSAIPPLENKR